MNILPPDFDPALFLSEYWQKKPVLIRGQKAFVDPIGIPEIAGLACEEFIESRLIVSDADRKKWQVHNGPFTEEFLKGLPNSHWSLLVQAVDQWHDDVRALVKDFNFIPNWRIDDVMISLASDEGGVGPHFDYYDVFLIQGHGKKRWRLGGPVDSNTPLLPDNELKLLNEFDTQEDWIVEPGDILYVPPNIAHYGVSIGNSVTYSVGFRTPSVVELLDDFSNDLMEGLHEEQRYVDTAPKKPTLPGKIENDVGEQLMALLQSHLADKPRITRTFGKYMTQPKYPYLLEHSSPVTVEQLLTAMKGGLPLGRNPSSRFAFAELEANDDSLGMELYVDGKAFPCPASMQALLPSLCDPFADEIDWQDIAKTDTACAELLVTLYNQGSLWLVDQSDEDEEA